LTLFKVIAQSPEIEREEIQTWLMKTIIDVPLEKKMIMPTPEPGDEEMEGQVCGEKGEDYVKPEVG
jgi:hypothetical protein